ncbi:hypothetical protein [Roseibacillus ishigakijimensis]|uniref:Uncharacterized protein n=1 Tax=Roseibacillus ishigakijimensis TaxID=454146 RepID=A0A934RRS9_9BACT|nr:hypothetical protein [Roseibacillus ishigakijimensis]MBK1833844.1 hypothetical protein [Roseibacillus ishigakijimensis]
MISQKAVKAGLLVQAGLITVASAHPGPPGHTHGDDWPFAPIAVGFLLALSCTGLAARWVSNRPARQLQAQPVRVKRR